MEIDRTCKFVTPENIEIGDNVYIGFGGLFIGFGGISIGN